MSLTRLRSTIAAAVAASTLAACAASERSPLEPLDLTLLNYDQFLDGAIHACKAGGPAGTYYFNVTATGGGDYVLGYSNPVAIEFDGVNQNCKQVWTPINGSSWLPSVTGTVTIAEVVPANMQVDSIIIRDSRNSIWLPTMIGPSSVTLNVDAQANYFYAKFYNGETPPPPPPPGRLEVCKVGGPAGSYTFHVDVVGGGSYTLPNGADASVAFDGSHPACVTMYVPASYTTWPAGTTASVEVSENGLSADVQTKSITVVLNGVTGSPILNSSSTSVTMGWTDIATVNYVNELKGAGFQGCTPGYWKVKQHWDSWAATGYTTGQALSTVFIIPNTYILKNKWMGSYSMVQGLSFQGGSTLSGKAEILLRAAVAGVLNTTNSGITYFMTQADLIAAVNAALASGDANVITSLAARIDTYNNALGGCPLN